jgi:hypothetical protein
LLRAGGLPWDYSVVSSISPDAGAAEPFAADGDSVGVLILHGFTGSPQTIRPLANSYHVATLDNDAPEIFDGSLAFIRDHVRAQTQ